MVVEDMLNQILLEMARLKRDVSMIKLAVARDVEEDNVPEGHDAQLVDGYAISMTKKVGSNGKKNPVLYLYNAKMPNKTLAVYQSESHMLPTFMREKVDWNNGEYQRIIEAERQDVIDAGLYHECPSFRVLRKHGEMLDNGHSKKDLAGVLWLSPEAQALEDEILRKQNGVATEIKVTGKQQPPQKQQVQQQSVPQTKAPRFASADEAIEWATKLEIKAQNDSVCAKKFKDRDAAKNLYDIMKSEWKPQSATEMFGKWSAWVQVETTVKWCMAKNLYSSEDECRVAIGGDYSDDVEAKTKMSKVISDRFATLKAEKK